MSQFRFKRGDIVTSAPGWAAGCFAITDVHPDRPKNAYDGINVVTGKRYKLCDESLGDRIGAATEEFLSGNAAGQAGNLGFERGQLRAQRAALYDLPNKDRWELLAKVKPGDLLKINIYGRSEQVTFVSVLEKGDKYVFLATDSRGTTHRYPLAALVLEDRTG